MHVPGTWQVSTYTVPSKIEINPPNLENRHCKSAMVSKNHEYPFAHSFQYIFEVQKPTGTVPCLS